MLLSSHFWEVEWSPKRRISILWPSIFLCLKQLILKRFNLYTLTLTFGGVQPTFGVWIADNDVCLFSFFEIFTQAWAGMTFAHFRLGMGNGQAYFKLLELGMGIKNQILNFWDLEWEWKLNSQHLEMENFIYFPKKLVVQLGIIKRLFKVKHHVEPA